LIERLAGNSPDDGIRVPTHPSTNSFNGKHVFKAIIRQRNPPDPIFVATKGAVNLARQWGMRLLPGCVDKSSSGLGDDIQDDPVSAPTTPQKNRTGFEAEFNGFVPVTPESPSPTGLYGIDGSGWFVGDDSFHWDDDASSVSWDGDDVFSVNDFGD
jgi:hypothetical protein